MTAVAQQTYIIRVISRSGIGWKAHTGIVEDVETDKTYPFASFEELSATLAKLVGKPGKNDGGDG